MNKTQWGYLTITISQDDAMTGGKLDNEKAEAAARKKIAPAAQKAWRFHSVKVTAGGRFLARFV